MVLSVCTYSPLMFNQTMANVESDYPGLHQLISDMWETMYNIHAVGLAAPQIGQPLKIITIDPLLLLVDEALMVDKREKILMINPEITEMSRFDFSFVESCCPGCSKNSMIRVKYVDENFIEHNDVYTGIIARLVQYEYAYLEREIFNNYLSLIQKNLSGFNKYNFTSY